MTTKADFTPEEWTLLRAAPVLAGLRVAVADYGGYVEEAAAVARAFVEAHERLWSDPPTGGVVDEVIAAGPVYDRDQFGDAEKMDAERIVEASDQSLREAVALLERKASPAEQRAYREFLLGLARRVAEAHREAGVFDRHAGPVSDRERAALAELASVFPPEPLGPAASRTATKADFTPEEWTLLRAAPVLAGLRVAVAEPGGTFDEVAAIAEAYGAAHERWWSNPTGRGLVDEIIADGPVYDRDQFGTPPDHLATGHITDAATKTLREAITLLQQKATTADLHAYRDFVLDLARRVAQAHQEPGRFTHSAGPVSDAERQALTQLESHFPTTVWPQAQTP
jgi:hypothetical protein